VSYQAPERSTINAGRLWIIEKIGAGGMGGVHLEEHAVEEGKE
jgi:hypothetical protein